MCSPHLPLLFIPSWDLRFCSNTPFWKLKKLFQKAAFLFSFRQSSQVFHIVVLMISCGREGGELRWSRLERDRGPKGERIAVGTPVARSAATSSWLKRCCPSVVHPWGDGVSSSVHPWGDGASSAASPSPPRLISCSPRRCRRGWWPGCRWVRWGCIRGRWGCTWSLWG